MDIDLALRLQIQDVDRLERELAASFFVDPEPGRDAVRRRTSFNVIHRETMLKVDLFVLGDASFDREQLLDAAYLQRWAESLGLTELLEHALREASVPEGLEP